MTQRASAPRAVVLGDLELVQALGRAGIRCIVVGPPGSKVRRSRFVHAAIDAAAPTELATEDDALVAALLTVARNEPEKPVLMCDSDEALDFLGHNRSVLDPAVRMMLPPTQLLQDLNDKARFQALAEQLGLPVPDARAARPAAEPPPGLRPPVVVKPVPHRGAGWTAVAGEEKALIAESDAALEILWERLAAASIEVLVQEAVIGPETDIVSYHAYADRDGEIVGEFTGRKIRTFPAERGMSTALVTTDDAEVARLGRDVMRRIGLCGAAKLDFKLTAGGELRLLEVNPRFTLWAHAGAVAGANLPALMYGDLAGRPRLPRRRARGGVRWVALRRDREAARAAGIPLARWLVWALSCETNSAFAWRDPAPLLALRKADG